MSEIKARAVFHNHELTDVMVVNPAGWFGKTWLVEIGGSYCPLFLIVEADSVCDAIDELADSDQWGHLITVDEADLDDYPEDERTYGPTGQVLDLDHLLIHGQEGVDCPFPCRYYGEGLPPDGVSPTEYYCWEDE